MCELGAGQGEKAMVDCGRCREDGGWRWWMRDEGRGMEDEGARKGA
jgi:hypothetical protein